VVREIRLLGGRVEAVEAPNRMLRIMRARILGGLRGGNCSFDGCRVFQGMLRFIPRFLYILGSRVSRQLDVVRCPLL
jgi:hypothetical protein